MSLSGGQRMVGKIALVTGAASGIGKATAQRLAAEGAKVALADLNEPESARVAEAIRLGGGQALALRLDVTSEADWEAAAGRILAEWGRLDICVNCAGIASARPITDTSLADWRQVLATNLDGVFLGTKHALRVMRDRDAALKALVTERGFAEPEEVAAAVLFLASDEARQITGTDLAVDAGFSIG